MCCACVRLGWRRGGKLGRAGRGSRCQLAFPPPAAPTSARHAPSWAMGSAQKKRGVDPGAETAGSSELLTKKPENMPVDKPRGSRGALKGAPELSSQSRCARAGRTRWCDRSDGLSPKERADAWFLFLVD
jgi:hypothetical protein